MAWAITDKYPTPSMLKRAYDECGGNDDDPRKQALLSGLLYDDRKKLPATVSKTLCWLYNKDQLN